MIMKKYWEELVSGIRSADDRGVYDALIKSYTEKCRHYHTATHLEHLFTLLDEYDTLIKDRPALIAAIFFHDVVYDPTSPSNEVDSAKIAVFYLASLGASQEFCTRVADLIRMTASHKSPDDDFDARLFLDMDMAILGAAPAVYQVYAANVRGEYEPFFGADAYNRGRLNKFILPCLAAERLFSTDIMHERYDAQARANLAHEKAALEARLLLNVSKPSL